MSVVENVLGNPNNEERIFQLIGQNAVVKVLKKLIMTDCKAVTVLVVREGKPNDNNEIFTTKP